MRSAQRLYGTKRPRCLNANCQQKMRPVLVAPTQLKDYRNPHLNRVWFEAERRLRAVSRLVFVGSSLPESDVEVIYLLKRTCPQSRVRPQDISVVEYHPKPEFRGIDDHPTYPRYEALFGSGLSWCGEGVAAWCDQQRSGNGPSPRSRARWDEGGAAIP